MSRAGVHYDGLLVVGAGGHGKVVAAAAIAAGHRVAGFLDDVHAGGTVLGLPVLGPVDRLSVPDGAMAVLAIGDNHARATLAARFSHVDWVVVVHPGAWVHESAQLGPGTVVMARAVIQPEARVGAHVIVNTAAVVEHECRVEDFAHLASGVVLGGKVHVGRSALLGTGAVVRTRATVGEGAVVGAGAVVIGDVPAHVAAVGCPARPRRQ